MNQVFVKINFIINKRYSQIPFKYLEREGANVFLYT